MADTSREQVPPQGWWGRLDAGVYRVEGYAVVLATAIMTISVFLAVVWRIFAAPTGKVADMLGHALESDAEWIGTAGDGIAYVVWVGLCVFAAKTAQPSWSLGRAAVTGGGFGVAFVLGGLLFVWLVPDGLVFSQRVALCLLMWIVMLGSSMAAHTRRHIFLQAAQKLVHEDDQRKHAAFGLVLAAVFTGFLGWVGGQYALRNLQHWLTTDMTAGIFESIPIPYWTVTLAIPLGFGMTMARFLGQAVAIWRGLIPAVPVNEEIEAASEVDLEANP